MQNVDDILSLAKNRALEKKLPYLGELTPKEAYILIQQASALLVDVRSQAELDLVGRVPDATHIEWAFYPGMIANAEFGAQLKAKVAQDKTIIFMCRTGGRSHNAAVLAQQLGYSKSFNMAEGFEGEANAQKQRTLINGWKQANLPWNN
ncbi:MAG: rhodanese-like domain-containing protein [Pseudomonadota bacterium]